MIIRLSNHARERMKQRGLSEKQIRSVIKNPDSVIEGDQYYIYQSIMESDDGKTHMLRVFVNRKKKLHLVVTAYKTSKIEKYS